MRRQAGDNRRQTSGWITGLRFANNRLVDSIDLVCSFAQANAVWQSVYNVEYFDSKTVKGMDHARGGDGGLSGAAALVLGQFYRLPFALELLGAANSLFANSRR
ncbi:MAG: hypothetical protein JO108_16275 [Acidobacteriaceae bacterium]|nr:hypothetical protein [Acidobacteriaceae bacterium]